MIDGSEPEFARGPERRNPGFVTAARPSTTTRDAAGTLQGVVTAELLSEATL